jgi:hypothetical protein
MYIYLFIYLKKLEWVWGSLILLRLTFGSWFLGWNLLEVRFFACLFKLKILNHVKICLNMT